MKRNVLPVVLLCILALTAGCTNGLGSAFGDPKPDDDTKLSSLFVSDGTLSPAFDPEVTSYSVRLSAANSVTIIPVSQNPDASIAVNGKAVASGNPADAINVADDPLASTIVVSAPRAENKTYSVNFYVDDFVVQDAYLKPNDATEEARFGSAVATSGNIIVVGTNKDSVYVLEKDASGNWSQTATLTGSNTETGDSFGCSVSVSGNTIVVGASGEESSASGVINIDGIASLNNSLSISGAAYVFVKNSKGAWIQDAYLKASNPDEMDYFGDSVSISGDRIVVGADGESSSQNSTTNDNGSASTNNTLFHSGAAYVFAKDFDGNWIQDAYLKASNADAGDHFGGSVAISNDIIVVGACFESNSSPNVINYPETVSSDNLSDNSGAAYVFKKDSVGNWIQDAYLKPSNPDAGDYFGASVSVDGKTIVIATEYEDSSQSGITNIDNEASSDNSLPISGAVYVFTEDANGSWFQDAYIKAFNPGGGDFFGWDVSLSGNYILVGVYGEASAQAGITNVNDFSSTDNSLYYSGAAYLFKKDTKGNWLQDAYIKPSNTDERDGFGTHVFISGDTIVVGAPYEDSNQTSITNADGEASTDNSVLNSGAAYVFTIIP